MQVANKETLRNEIVTLRNKLKASDFKLELLTAQLTSESELRKRAEVRVEIAEAEVKVLNYAIKYLEANQK